MRFAAQAGWVAVLCVCFFASPARACSVCQAGDPVFSGGAATPRPGGSGSLFIEYQGYRKDSGLLPEEIGEPAEEGDEVNRGRLLNVLLSFGLTERLTLSLQAPFKSNFIRERPDEEEAGNSRLRGLGDVSLTADFVVWRDRPVLPSSWLSLRLFGKAPTGKDRTREDGRVDPHLQLGTGSWDLGAGIGGGRRFEWGSLYGSALYRMNRQGANRYEYGDVVSLNAAVETPVGRVTGGGFSESTVVGLELNYRHARRDEFGDSLYRDSGGSILYVTPSFRVRIPWPASEGDRAPSLRLATQVPLGDGGLRGRQHEGLVWSIGLVVPLL